MRHIAAFDFDGTLIRGDSLLPFLYRVAGRRRLALAALRTAPALARIPLGGGHRDHAKEALIAATLRDLPVDEVALVGRQYADDLLRRVRPDRLARLQWHQRQGHGTVIVSASPAVYLEPLGEVLHVDAVLATRLADDGRGRLTGALLGANCRGPEKCARLATFLPEEGCVLWAYGDSAGDREMLAAADRPTLLARRTVLAAAPELEHG